MPPINKSLPYISNCSSWVRLDKDDGKVPVNVVWTIVKSLSLVRRDKDDGILPVMPKKNSRTVN